MFEFTFQFDTENHQHLYEQIYIYIKNEIREGKLPRGEKLPSSRALAEYLQVSRSTVCLAYEQLLSEGYVETKPYKGYYVCCSIASMTIWVEGWAPVPKVRPGSRMIFFRSVSVSASQ